MVKNPSHPLARFRAAQELTQADVAAEVGVTQSAVSHWEAGRFPRRAALARLIELSGGALSPADFLPRFGAQDAPDLIQEDGT